jgi:hypothetical protein
VRGSFAEVRGEAIELVLPESPVGLEPLRGFLQWRRGEPAAADAPVAPPLDEPGALQHREVLADRGERHREGSGEVPDGRLAAGEAGEDGPARGVGERAEHDVQRGATVNHMV